MSCKGFVCHGYSGERVQRAVETEDRNEAANEFRSVYKRDPYRVGNHYLQGRCACGCDRVIWYGDNWFELHNGDIRPHRFLADHVLIAGPKREAQ